ncbi:hypothetical protein B0H17DRAFT_1214174 [Mycena rosella]|uniref:Uncharacterized protein n=1 Tax=Mycena rosella TaxID=1033263 RepID=A0AAD7CNQ9_MYCRO|nr:hypothetical protein B0H17DRAFT_1214174 [Mycena rosella]
MCRFLPRTAKTAAATSAPVHRAPSPSPEPAPKLAYIEPASGANSGVNAIDQDSAGLDPLVLKRLREGFEREVRKLVLTAKQNKVVMSKFNFERAYSNKKQRDNNNINKHTWMDGVPRMVVSADSVPLVIHLPGSIKEGSTSILLAQLIEFVDALGGKLPKCAGADKEGCGMVTSYNNIAGQIASLFKMTKAWHALGHDHDDRTVASYILKSGRTFSYGDEPHFAACKKLRAEAEKRHKFLKDIW